jgi:hypothetical protein
LAGAAALRVGMSSTGAALPLIATRCEDSGAGFFTLLPFVLSCILVLTNCHKLAISAALRPLGSASCTVRPSVIELA